MSIPPNKNANVIFKTNDREISALINREIIHMKSLAKLDEIKIDSGYKPSNSDASAIIKDVEIYVPLKGLIDIEKEKARIQKEIDKALSELERIEKKLSNENFLQKAREDVIIKEKSKRDEAEDLLKKLRISLSKLG